MNLNNLFFSIYQRIIFLLEPEKAHSVSLYLAEIIYKSSMKRFLESKTMGSKCKVMGIDFKNSLGLAAGFDKNGDYLNFISNIGFGFIEIGTITPNPQFGNPKPRVFRIKNERGIINHLGFNNKGVKYLKSKLSSFERSCPIGINIGKNSTTQIENSISDYEYCMKELYEYADYITLNISSPNTEDLRLLHLSEYLEDFLQKIKKIHEDLNKKYKKYVPLCIKVSPDLSTIELEVFCRLLLDHGIDGIIATNTTIQKNILQDDKYHFYQGGLSGQPLFNKSNQKIEEIKSYVKDKIAIIGVGGITSPETALDKINKGSDLLQLYSGLVYSGTGLIKDITKALK